MCISKICLNWIDTQLIDFFLPKERWFHSWIKSFINTSMNPGWLSLTCQIRSANELVDLAKKWATIFVDRLTNLMSTFLSFNSDKQNLHSFMILLKYDRVALKLVYYFENYIWISNILLEQLCNLHTIIE